MANLMKILVALDTSPASWVALEETNARNWPAHSSFEVVSVVEPTHLWTTSEVAQEAADRALDVVKRAAARLKAEHVNVTSSVLSGDPRRQILARARAIGADLIVVGSRGLSPINRLLVGKVAAYVLRHAPCSVAIMRQRNLRSEAVLKVILAVDGSEAATEAVRSVAARPWPAGTELRLLSVVQLTLPGAHAFFEVPFIQDEVVENARAEAMKRSLDAIECARKILAPTGLPISDNVSVLVDQPREIIINEAANWGADLIVLGAHGHNAADLLLLGSTSEGVANHADCSVEVIRAAKHSGTD
jgi:nucleotide-binding universal stress UspA family protein